MPTKSPKRGHLKPPPKTGPSPGSHSSEGWVKLPAGLVRPPPRPSRKGVAAQQNTRGKRKQAQKKPRKTLAASRPKKKRPQKVQGESQKRTGPRWHPEKTTKKRDARPKRAKQTKAAGHKKRKGTAKQGACEGVSCCYLNCLSSKKKTRKNDVDEKPEERTTPKNTRPDIKRIFPNTFGSEPPEIKQKHRQKPTKKHKTNNETQKQKFAPENFSKKRP